jgi:5-methylcytosine-specific restriction enzyme A
MTEVAPGVRFSDFDIFLTPALAFAIDFIWRTSSLVHSRRTIFLALAILTPVLVRRPCITRHDDGNGMTKWRVYRCQQRRRAARPSASARGYGADWQALRASTPHTPKAGYDLDHIKARNAGGTDDASNLAWRCHRCHSRKTAKHDGGFGHPRTASQTFH